MLKILIVDDSIFSQKVIASTLNKFLKSAEFYFAADGEEGLAKYKEIGPDYVFMDLLMPKMDGHTLIRAIKEYHANANIIVVSADVQKTVKDEIEAYNILTFLNKPFTEGKAKSICAILEEK